MSGVEGEVVGERLPIHGAKSWCQQERIVGCFLKAERTGVSFFFFEMEFHSCYPGWSAMA